MLVVQKNSTITRSRTHVIPNASSNPQKHKIITKLWKFAKRNAEQKCKDNIDKECAIAWDTVHDYETTLRRIQLGETKKDPLEFLCDIEPDIDECRSYDV